MIRARRWARGWHAILAVAIVSTACAGDETTPRAPWVEEEVVFDFDGEQLFGVVTLPTDGDAPLPAVVLVSGSADVQTGLREGVASTYYTSQARASVLDGYAVLRYDPPGVGQSSGEPRLEIMADRAAEAVAALRYLQGRSDVRADQVGLWGESQGSWVIASAAADHPDEVAFIISVSGAGISVAEQQIWGFEAQTRAAGLSETDVTKAGLVGRLLIDWQVSEPIYRLETQAALEELPPGPWADFAETVYATTLTPAESLATGIELLEEMQAEPWAAALYLEELLVPRLKAIPPEQLEEVRAQQGQSLGYDPAESLARVRCPVLAFFGADDIVQPSERSAAIYEAQLAKAGNEDVTISLLPGVDHNIGPRTPAYTEGLSTWLRAHA